MPSATKPWHTVLDLLACPDTLQPLQELEEGKLRVINEHIQQGQCRKVSGQKHLVPLKEALIRADGKIVYRIDNGIIVLLREEGILFPN
jgi:uncharacterized protein YbaR (Trm112 family)